MCTADAVRVSGDAFDSAADALGMAGTALDYLNSPAVADLDGNACGELLIGLGELQAKLTAAHAAFLRRFDAANANGTERGRVRSAALSPEAWRAMRYAMARLAVELVSGPAGVAAVLRQGLLDKPYNTPSLPLDIGYSHTIPWQIRRAVLLRDRKCAWPRCGRPAVYCDVHHLRHKEDGGETSLENCICVCQFHHDVCIHRRGWQLILHPDGTTEARSPDGKQILYSHAPPTEHAA